VTDDPQMRANIFDNFWREFSNGVKSSLDRRGVKAEVISKGSRKTTIGGFEAYEHEFVIGDAHGTVRAVVSGGYGYAIGALSFFGQPGEEHRSFLKSFSLRAQP
jgi:hypothetical protein